MKPCISKNGADGFITATVTLHFGNIGFIRDTERFHHRYRRFRWRYRVLNFGVGRVHSKFAASVRQMTSRTLSEPIIIEHPWLLSGESASVPRSICVILSEF